MIRIYPELTAEEKWRIDYERQKLFGARPIYYDWRRKKSNPQNEPKD